MIPEKETLEKYLEILQCIMRVQDWNVTVEAMTGDKFYKTWDSDDQAHNDINRLLKTSHIDLNMDDSDDWYNSLVHELMHLVVDAWYFQDMLAIEYLDGKVKENVIAALKIGMEQTVQVLANVFCGVYPQETLEEGIEEDGDDVG